ncbi:OIT3-like protein, partial [Mya arenaria]
MYLIRTATTITTPFSDDPCISINHRNITNLGLRYAKNTECSQHAISDFRLPQRWYYAGPDPMLTSPPDQLCACGTSLPIWMNGLLPQPSDGIVSREACQKYVGSCDLRLHVEVKNCGDFYVYKLSPTREDNTAYCFGVNPPGYTEPPTTITTPISDDPCISINRQIITNLGLRYAQNTECSQHAISDFRLPQRWYYAGLDPILTSPPDQLCACGTSLPIWMNGSLPQPSDGIVSREACQKYAGSCDLRLHIEVKNCGDFYVYKLPPTKEDNTAYCFGVNPPGTI